MRSVPARGFPGSRRPGRRAVSTDLGAQETWSHHWGGHSVLGRPSRPPQASTGPEAALSTPHPSPATRPWRWTHTTLSGKASEMLCLHSAGVGRGPRSWGLQLTQAPCHTQGRTRAHRGRRAETPTYMDTWALWRRDAVGHRSSPSPGGGCVPSPRGMRGTKQWAQ